jgi:thioesterase domain-containing protein
VRGQQLARYAPRPYPGRITLLANAAWHRADPTLGWDAAATGGLDVLRLPGEHGTYLRHHTETLAEMVRALLDQIEAE